jgi:hypothetical protein
MPIVARDGVTASPMIAMPIIQKETIIAGLRPCRSPILPITRAPIGRVTNPAPKVASEANRLVDGSFEGKKALPI